MGKNLSININRNTLLVNIRKKYPALTEVLKKIADYILNNHEEATYLSISDLARKIEVSESMITKFTRLLGFNGFQEFKISLARTSSQSKTDEIIFGEISLDEDVKSICKKIYHNNIDALMDSLSILDYDDVERAAEIILTARKVDLYGSGSSSVATLNAWMRFYRLGIMCFSYRDSHSQGVSASLLQECDVAIGVSNSGMSADIVKALEIAKQCGASTICITNYDNTPITQYADIKLFTATRDSTDFCESLHSRIAELSLIDALYMTIASKMKSTALDNLKASSKAIKYRRLDM